MSPRMPNYDELRAREARAKVTEFKSPEDIEDAYRSFAAKVARFNAAIEELGRVARKVSRDLARATRRPSLIHNGGRPRANR